MVIIVLAHTELKAAIALAIQGLTQNNATVTSAGCGILLQLPLF